MPLHKENLSVYINSV